MDLSLSLAVRDPACLSPSRWLLVLELRLDSQIEMLNLFAGFEQANKYAITDLSGTPVGFLAEEDAGVLGTVTRQALRTRRPFKAVVLDLEGKPLLWVCLFTSA